MKFDKQENSKAMLEDLSKEGEREIAAAIKKLIYDFGESLREMVMMELDNYSGLEIKNFVEKQLPTKIKREIKQWYERYSPTIYVMLQKYEEALVIKLAEEFNTGVEKLNIMQDSKMPICLDVKIIDIYCEDISTIPVTAGFIAGGLSLATILMGVPILFPIAGMAGYPIIQKMMTEKKLHEAKNKLKPMLNQVLDDLIQKFQETIGTIVGSLIQDIQNAAVKRFDDYIKYIKMQVQEEIKDREVDSKQETMKIEQLDKAGKLLETMINNQT